MTTRDLLEQIVEVNQSRFDRGSKLAEDHPGAISLDDVDLLRLDVLLAELELARYDEEHPCSPS